MATVPSESERCVLPAGGLVIRFLAKFFLAVFIDGILHWKDRHR